ncbi:MAG TPA: archaellin/type IV pilin N-terminal domain-containing protein [Thermoplasmata archaeon]|nr:archaellin/type IV pilin N-terminal domain-containing protein [Thermoplasmata archaeon]
MTLPRRWRRASRRGISEIIAAVFLIALTIVAGTILWTFKVYTPPNPPTMTVLIRSGGSNPVWGDPTDCQPQGYNTTRYPMWGNALRTWYNLWNDQCEDHVTGNFSTLNSTEFIIDTHTPSIIPLTQIQFVFVCNNATGLGGRTILVNGSLSSMTWFPGVSDQPAAGAPYLGYCGNFNAASLTAANGIYYNRLGLFMPITQGVNYVENGDTFILYIHNGGYPLDFECPVNTLEGNYYFSGENSTNGCQHHFSNGTAMPIPQLDYDDYHGAPPWCFLTLTACTIYLIYTGYPYTVLATIPVYSLAPPKA